MLQVGRRLGKGFFLFCLFEIFKRRCYRGTVTVGDTLGLMRLHLDSLLENTQTMISILQLLAVAFEDVLKIRNRAWMFI